MWGAYLQPFSLKRRASKHFSRHWKASSRSSCHISSFWAVLRSTISRWGLCVRDFFLSPISLFPSPTPAPQPAPARRSSHPLPIRLALAPPSLYTLQFSLCLPQDGSRLAPSFQPLHYSPFSPITPTPRWNAAHVWLLGRRFMCMLCLSKSLCSKTSMSSIQKTDFSDRKSHFSETRTQKRCLKTPPFCWKVKRGGAQIKFSAQLMQDCG